MDPTSPLHFTPALALTLVGVALALVGWWGVVIQANLNAHALLMVCEKLIATGNWPRLYKLTAAIPERSPFGPVVRGLFEVQIACDAQAFRGATPDAAFLARAQRALLACAAPQLRRMNLAVVLSLAGVAIAAGALLALPTRSCWAPFAVAGVAALVGLYTAFRGAVLTREVSRVALALAVQVLPEGSPPRATDAPLATAARH